MAIKYLNWAWRQNLKTPLQKLVLLKLGDNADDTGRAFPSIDTIAKFTCASEKTVRNNLKSLEALKLITIYKEPARTGYQRNEYKLHFEVVLHYENDAVEEKEPVTDTATLPVTDTATLPVTDTATYRKELPTNHQFNPQIINPQKEHGSSVDKPPVKIDDFFESAWKQYPKREGSNPKNKAYSAWKARLKEGVTAERMMEGIQRYGYYCQQKGQLNTSYVMQAQRFFGPGLEFDNEWSITTAKTAGVDMDNTGWINDMGDVL